MLFLTGEEPLQTLLDTAGEDPGAEAEATLPTSPPESLRSGFEFTGGYE